MSLSVPVLVGAGRGHRFDPAGLRTSARIALGRYEPAVDAFLREVLAEASVFVDVGAHTGYFSRVALRTMPAAGRIVAFEPDDEAREQLRAVGDAPRLEVRAEALGGADADGTLLVTPGSCSRLDTTAPQGSGASSQSVQVRALDNLIAAGEFPAPDVLKIDVEGAETAVLAGATAALAAVRALVVECHSMPLLHEVLGVVLDAGFDLVRTTEGGDLLGPPTVLARRTTAPQA